MKLLDLFCRAGGTSMGYFRAGFEVTGVDIEPQKRYPFRFIQADALEYLKKHWMEYDVIAASPPCQDYSLTKSIHNKNPNRKVYPRLIEPLRELLLTSSKPYIIENVPQAPLINPIVLCGTMFPELRVYRHRHFESNLPLLPHPNKCNHVYSMPPLMGMYHTLDKHEFITCVGHNFQAKSGRIAMGIEWMTRDELAEAIPPAYTEFIGRQIIKILS